MTQNFDNEDNNLLFDDKFKDKIETNCYNIKEMGEKFGKFRDKMNRILVGNNSGNNNELFDHSVNDELLSKLQEQLNNIGKSVVTSLQSSNLSLNENLVYNVKEHSAHYCAECRKKIDKGDGTYKEAINIEQKKMNNKVSKDEFVGFGFNLSPKMWGLLNDMKNYGDSYEDCLRDYSISEIEFQIKFAMKEKDTMFDTQNSQSNFNSDIEKAVNEMRNNVRNVHYKIANIVGYIEQYIKHAFHGQKEAKRTGREKIIGSTRVIFDDMSAINPEEEKNILDMEHLDVIYKKQYKNWDKTINRTPDYIEPSNLIEKYDKNMKQFGSRSRYKSKEDLLGNAAPNSNLLYVKSNHEISLSKGRRVSMMENRLKPEIHTKNVVSNRVIATAEKFVDRQKSRRSITKENEQNMIFGTKKNEISTRSVLNENHSNALQLPSETSKYSPKSFRRLDTSPDSQRMISNRSSRRHITSISPDNQRITLFVSPTNNTDKKSLENVEKSFISPLSIKVIEEEDSPIKKPQFGNINIKDYQSAESKTIIENKVSADKDSNTNKDEVCSIEKKYNDKTIIEKDITATPNFERHTLPKINLDKENVIDNKRSVMDIKLQTKIVEQNIKNKMTNIKKPFTAPENYRSLDKKNPPKKVVEKNFLVEKKIEGLNCCKAINTTGNWVNTFEGHNSIQNSNQIRVTSKDKNFVISNVNLDSPNYSQKHKKDKLQVVSYSHINSKDTLIQDIDNLHRTQKKMITTKIKPKKFQNNQKNNSKQNSLDNSMEDLDLLKTRLEKIKHRRCVTLNTSDFENINYSTLESFNKHSNTNLSNQKIPGNMDIFTTNNKKFNTKEELIKSAYKTKEKNKTISKLNMSHGEKLNILYDSPVKNINKFDGQSLNNSAILQSNYMSNKYSKNANNKELHKLTLQQTKNYSNKRKYQEQFEQRKLSDLLNLKNLE